MHILKVINLVKIDRIKSLMKEKGLKVQFVCSQLGASRYKFYDWERGKSSPSENDLKVLSDILDVSIDYLLGNTDEKKPPAKSQGDTVALHITDFHGQEPEVIEISREKYEKIQKILKIMEDEQDKESDNDSRIF